MPILAFFTDGIGRWIVLAVIVSAGFAWGCHHLINIGRQQVLAENQKAAIKIVTKQGAVTTQVVDHYIKVKGETLTVTKEVEKEVVKYAEANTGLCLDADWRRLHDSAALNTLPKAGQPIDGKGSQTTYAPIRLRSAYSLASLDYGNAELRTP